MRMVELILLTRSLSLGSSFIFAIEQSGGRLRRTKGGAMFKGYYVSTGYMGLVNGTYMLFATEREYVEYMEES